MGALADIWDRLASWPAWLLIVVAAGPAFLIAAAVSATTGGDGGETPRAVATAPRSSATVVPGSPSASTSPSGTQAAIAPTIGIAPTIPASAGTPGTSATRLATAVTGTPSPGSGTPAPATAGGTYTVVSGDNPTEIAIKLGVPAAQRDQWVQDMLRLNNVAPTALQVGQVLRLPSGTTISASPSAGTPQATATRVVLIPSPSATGCGSFTSANVRLWCQSPGGDELDCSDFPNPDEATRFTREYDRNDRNKLDPNSNGTSCE
jgi:LysM repeat protein